MRRSRGAPVNGASSPTLSRRLSGVDAAFLYLERKEIPLHIAGVCLFDGPIPFAEFLDAIDSKLHLLPRYRQRVVEPQFHLGYPTWEDDPNFDIRKHVIQARVEPPGGQEQFEALAGRVLTQVMDRSKPLWDICVVEGLQEGRGGLIVRVHHSLADGVAGAAIMRVILDPTPEGSHSMRRPRHRPKRGPEPNGSVADALTTTLRASLESLIAAESILLDLGKSLLEERTQDALQKLVALVPEFGASSERFVFNKPCTGDRRFCWMEFPLDAAQSVRQVAGGTLNDVILTVIARGISKYVRLHGEAVKGRYLRVVCPVNARTDDRGESLGNQISFLPIALPLDVEGPLAFLRAVSARTEVMKSSRAAHLVALAATWLGAAPPPLQAWFWQTLPTIPLPAPLFHMICTNVPGSPLPLYAAGRKMIASYPHVPTGYELGVNCAVQSYDGKLFGGFTADSNVVPDVARLRDLAAASFDELARAAGARKPRRKRPESASQSASGKQL